VTRALHGESLGTQLFTSRAARAQPVAISQLWNQSYFPILLSKTSPMIIKPVLGTQLFTSRAARIQPVGWAFHNHATNYIFPQSPSQNRKVFEV